MAEDGTVPRVVGLEGAGKVGELVQHEMAQEHHEQAEALRQQAGVPGRRGQHGFQGDEVEMEIVAEGIAEDG